MTTTLPLTILRDIITDWEQSASLNAAKYHEARQPYYGADLAFRRRIVPVDLARQLQLEDPGANVFHIQIKSVPAHILALEDFARWTPTSEYGVVWPAADWPKSCEHRMIASKAWCHQKEEHFAASYESDRLIKMAYAVQTRMPTIKNMENLLRACTSEVDVQRFIAVFEAALGITIYEPPANTTTHEDQSNDQLPAPKD